MRADAALHQCPWAFPLIHRRSLGSTQPKALCRASCGSSSTSYRGSPRPAEAHRAAALMPKEWEKKTGIKYLANKTIMTQCIQELESSETGDATEETFDATLPWTAHEELLSQHHSSDVGCRRSTPANSYTQTHAQYVASPLYSHKTSLLVVFLGVLSDLCALASMAQSPRLASGTFNNGSSRTAHTQAQAWASASEDLCVQLRGSYAMPAAGTLDWYCPSFVLLAEHGKGKCYRVPTDALEGVFQDSPIAH